MENNWKVGSYIIVALLLGFFSGFYFGSIVSYERGYSVGEEDTRVEIKTRLEDTRTIEPTPKEMLIISGTIQSIDDNKFVLESRLPFDPTLPAGEQVKTITKTVLVNSSTKISARVVEENREAPKTGEPFKPIIVRNVEIDFKSLKVADAVSVEASEDITNKSSFEAVTVFKNGQ